MSHDAGLESGNGNDRTQDVGCLGSDGYLYLSLSLSS